MVEVQAGRKRLRKWLAFSLILPMNMKRKGNLLTPTLSSTSVWRRGR